MGQKYGHKIYEKIFNFNSSSYNFLGTACTPISSEPLPGPDKQASGMILGAALGAGTGAVTGAQVASATGPGAWIGAGFGAVFGMLKGMGLDIIEEEQIAQEAELLKLKERTWAQGVLNEHYARRIEMHPDRDIYPADWFFENDKSELRVEACALINEIAKLQEQRKPWSRILIAVYNKAPKSSEYSKYLASKRAKAVAVQMVRGGIEPRRLLAKGISISQPVLIDPEDRDDRYNQAVEIIALDK